MLLRASSSALVGTAGVGTWLLSHQARAQVRDAIQIGASLPLSGDQAAWGQARLRGALAALAGAAVKGRAVTLLALDDAGQPERTLKNVQTLAAEPGLVALLGCGGAACNLALLPVLEAVRLPMVGPATGSEVLRASRSQWCFAVRAGYRDEAARLLTQLDFQGLNDLALLSADDPDSQDALAQLAQESARLGMRRVIDARLQSQTGGVDALAIQVAAARPHAVIVAAPAALAAAFARRWSAQGSRAGITVMADTGVPLPRLLGPACRGITVSQVLPSPWGTGRALIRRYQAALQAFDTSGATTADRPSPIGYASLEGWVNAEIVLRALKRGAGDPSREHLLAALESGAYELDELVLKWPPGQRRGLTFGEMTILSDDGRPLH